MSLDWHSGVVFSDAPLCCSSECAFVRVGARGGRDLLVVENGNLGVSATRDGVVGGLHRGIGICGSNGRTPLKDASRVESGVRRGSIRSPDGDDHKDARENHHGDRDVGKRKRPSRG